MIRLWFIKIIASATIMAGGPGLAWGQAIPQAERGTLIPCDVIEYTIFAKDNLLVNISPIPSKAKFTPRREGDYLFRAEGLGGKCYETWFGPGSPHPDHPTLTSGSFAIPEPENWTGFSILHGRKLIYTYTVRVIPSVVSKLRSIILKPSNQIPEPRGGAASTSRTVDWGGEIPDYAYIRIGWDQGTHWSSIDNFHAGQPTFEMPEWILKKDPNPILEIHAQYGFIKRVQILTWNDPQESK